MPKAAVVASREPILRARALAMVAERIHGATLVQLGAKFNCSTKTVKKTLDYAEDNGLVEQFEQKVLGELVPLAIEAYRKALQNGDTFVAKDVLSGMGITKKQKDAKREAPEGGDEDLDLEIYLKKRKRGILTDGDSNHRAGKTLPAAASSDVAEGELVEGPDSTPKALGPGVVEDSGKGSVENPDGFVDLSTYLGGLRDEQEDSE